MKSLFTTYKKIDPASVESLAIGGFDGIHVAHQKLLGELGSRGALLAIEKPVMGLTPGRAREYFCDKPIFYLDLKDVMQLSSEEFLQILLAEFTGLKKIVVGYDFRFGKARAGGIEDIKRAFSGSVCVVEDVRLEGVSIHATDIINLVRLGDIARANLYLGRAYMLEGAVIRGQGLGAKSLYPTINLQPQGGYTVPREGVYVGQTEIVEAFDEDLSPSQDLSPAQDLSSCQGLSAISQAQDLVQTKSAASKGARLYPSVIFVGHRLSTDGSFCIETHILGSAANFNAKKVKLYFLDFLRDNKKFSDLSQLKASITADINKAQSYFVN